MYTTAMEHWHDELQRLDLLLYIHMTAAGDGGTLAESDALRGLVLSEEEVFSLFEDKPAPEEMEALTSLYRKLHDMETTIDNRLRETMEAGKVLPLPYVRRLFGLSRFEAECLLLTMAVHLDRKYEKLYAYLQDDVTCKYPSAELAMKLFCRTEADKATARSILLRKLDPYVLRLVQRDHTGAGLPARELRMNERLVPFMLGSNRLDDHLAAFVHRHDPAEQLPEWVSGETGYMRFAAYGSALFHKQKHEHCPHAVLLWGKRGAGKKTWVRRLCSEHDFPLLLVDTMRLTSKNMEENFLLVFGESKLQQAALAFDRFQEWIDSDQTTRADLDLLTAHLLHHPWPVFLLADKPWTDTPKLLKTFDVVVPEPDVAERMRLWEYYRSGYSFDGDPDWSMISAQFRFTPGQISGALETARSLQEWENGQTAISEDTLIRACYRQVRHRLTDKSIQIRPTYTWNDLVLPPESKEMLRQVCNHVKYRQLVFGEWGFDRKLSYGKGLSMLFHGPPGTGKTMSAEVIAGELRLELYKIDLSRVVSKYIGETEKNLQVIFDEAEESHAILFFDEMDALFGKRSEVKDSHDKYANMEVSFLLQKMEEYSGITVLSTNFMQNMDEAFIRRIRFIINFPFPDKQDRERIWRNAFPEQVPLDEDGIDYDFLADTFEVTGSHIKNIAVTAAFLAADDHGAVGMKHLIRAARQELMKSGKVLMKSDLGEYEDYYI